MKLENNPYKGPFAFSSNDEDRFFGREKETNELVKLIQSCQLTVLLGASGTGKTSLIQAKLLTQLRREYFLPIYIRINFESADPLVFTQSRIIEELRFFDANVREFESGETLIEYAAKTTVFSGMIKPILFFDQFEELFTLGPKNNAHLIYNFMYQLADLIQLRLPDKLKESERYMNLLNFKVVFSLRQDWVAYLEDYSHIIPTILENRYRLKKFTASQALDAIVYPAKNIISLDTANKIIHKIGNRTISSISTFDQSSQNSELANIEVDPFVLSLYCFELFEYAKENDENYIVEETVENNSHFKIIRNYYDKNVLQFPTLKKMIEDKLLNESGKRLTLSLNNFTNGDQEILRITKQIAADTGILRIVGDEPFCEIEIVHDQVGDQIFESRTEEIRKIANQKEAEATKLRSSAKRAKRTTIFISISAIILFTIIIIKTSLTIHIKNAEATKLRNQADSIYSAFKKDKTAQGLREQLFTIIQTHGYEFDKLNKLINSQNATLKKLSLDTAKMKAMLRKSITSDEDIIDKKITAIIDLQTTVQKKEDLIKNLNSKIEGLNSKNAELEKRIIAYNNPVFEPSIEQFKITNSGDPLEKSGNDYLFKDQKDLNNNLFIEFSLKTDGSLIGRKLTFVLDCPVGRGKTMEAKRLSKSLNGSRIQPLKFDFSMPFDNEKLEFGKYSYIILKDGIETSLSGSFSIKKKS